MTAIRPAVLNQLRTLRDMGADLKSLDLGKTAEKLDVSFKEVELARDQLLAEAQGAVADTGARTADLRAGWKGNNATATSVAGGTPLGPWSFRTNAEGGKHASTTASAMNALGASSTGKFGDDMASPLSRSQTQFLLSQISHKDAYGKYDFAPIGVMHKLVKAGLVDKAVINEFVRKLAGDVGDLFSNRIDGRQVWMNTSVGELTEARDVMWDARSAATDPEVKKLLDHAGGRLHEMLHHESDSMIELGRASKGGWGKVPEETAAAMRALGGSSVRELDELLYKTHGVKEGLQAWVETHVGDVGDIFSGGIDGNRVAGNTSEQVLHAAHLVLESRQGVVGWGGNSGALKQATDTLFHMEQMLSRASSGNSGYKGGSYAEALPSSGEYRRSTGSAMNALGDAASTGLRLALDGKFSAAPEIQKWVDRYVGRVGDLFSGDIDGNRVAQNTTEAKLHGARRMLRARLEGAAPSTREAMKTAIDTLFHMEQMLSNANFSSGGASYAGRGGWK